MNKLGELRWSPFLSGDFMCSIKEKLESEENFPSFSFT